MPNFYADNPDLQFYVQKGIDWQRLWALAERGGTAPEAIDNLPEAVETYRSMLELLGGFAGDEVAPRAAAMDEKGIKLGADGKVEMSAEHDAIFAGLREMGAYGMHLPREVGGMNCPELLYYLISEMLARGDVSTMTHYAFHSATASALLRYSAHEGSTRFDPSGTIVETRFQAEIEEILAGDNWGSMELTEPGAGSDLSAIRTRAVQDDDGVWRLTGNKIFITSGHGQYRLVLAKTEDRQSLGALSLFLVRSEREENGKTVVNAVVDRVEDKIGHHASPTCSVQYDNSVGELLGKPGEGFRLMLSLMNHARVGVGFEGVGLCEAAYRMAKAYAEERETMGRPIAQHGMIANDLEDMDITVRGLRALAVEAGVTMEIAERGEWLQKHAEQMPDLDGDAELLIGRMKRRARYLTPLLKYAAAEEAVRLARINMQIHGGNGYMRDYAAERLMRDSLVLPVYEGTSQIQALMVMKDHLRDTLKNPQRMLQNLAASKVQAVRGKSLLERKLARLRTVVYTAQQTLALRVAKDKWATARREPWSQLMDRLFKKWDPRTDFGFAMLHAEHFTKMLVDLAVAEILVTQAHAHKERRSLALGWMERAIPRANYCKALIEETGENVLRALTPKDEKPLKVAS